MPHGNEAAKGSNDITFLQKVDYERTPGRKCYEGSSESMKNIRITLPDVEYAMLTELQNKGVYHRDFAKTLLSIIHDDYREKITRELPRRK